MVEMLNQHKTLFKIINLHFDMREWGNAEQREDGEIMLENACGTSACAIGSACFYPEFKKLGLCTKECNAGFEPRYKDYRGWDAVEKFFGITERQALYMFQYSSYKNDNVGPKDVAKRIKKFLKDGKYK